MARQLKVMTVLLLVVQASRGRFSSVCFKEGEIATRKRKYSVLRNKYEAASYQTH